MRNHDSPIAPGESFDVAPGRRWTSADHAFDALERMVIDGRLRPGDRLTETRLAAQLKLSRTPLRQALEKLVSKGWMRRTSSGAIHVVDVSEDEIEALYAVRGALEELMLRQAAARLGEEDLVELQAMLRVQELAAKAADADRVSRLGEEFHRRLWQLSANAVGQQFMEEVLQRTTRYRRLSFQAPYRFREGLKQHVQLVAALAKGDTDKACGIVRKHVDESRKYVLQAFKDWRRKESA